MVSVVEPSELAQACALVREQEGEAKFLGGGSALVLLMQLGLLRPRTLVGLRRLADVPGWREIAVADGELRIGGGVPLAAVAAAPLVAANAPSLAHAAGVVGNVRIRSVATMGGALAEADYASDLPAVLISLGAVATLSDGARARSLPVAELITDYFATDLAPDEVVTGVRLPVALPGGASVYLKFGSRSAEDRPCVGVAASARFTGRAATSLRVVVGAVAGTPQELPAVIAPCVGRALDAAVVDAIADGYAEGIDPIDDLRGSAWYRTQVIRAQVRRALRGLVIVAAAS